MSKAAMHRRKHYSRLQHPIHKGKDKYNISFPCGNIKQKGNYDMNTTTDKRATTLTEDKAREKEERAAVRQLIKSMSYEELHHLRFYAYGLKLCRN